MAISKEQFQQIIENSRRLFTPDAQNIINQKGQQYSKNYDPDPNSYNDIDDSIYLAETYQGDTSRARQSAMTSGYDPNIVAQSKMPEAIKKSLLESPIVNTMDPSVSVLDSYLPQQKAIKENKPVNSRPYAAQTQGVDYNIIKAIVEECIDRKLSEFKKTTLNESAGLQAINIKSGAIQLIDNKGKVFSAKLEYKGNLNDKK